MEFLAPLFGPLLHPFLASIGATVAGKLALGGLTGLNPQALVLKILAVLAFACLCAYGGWKLAHAFAAQDRIAQMNLALAEQDRRVKVVNIVDRRVTDELERQRAKADRTGRALDIALNSMSKCSVPSSVVGVFDSASGQPRDTPAPGPAGPAKPPSEILSGVDARDIIAVCQWNYSNVCIPNAIERDALRDLYNGLRSK